MDSHAGHASVPLHDVTSAGTFRDPLNPYHAPAWLRLRCCTTARLEFNQGGCASATFE
jgi:hypothetical protein